MVTSFSEGSPVTGTTNFPQLQSQYGGAPPSAGTGASGAGAGFMTPQEFVYLGTQYAKTPPVGYADDTNDWLVKNPESRNPELPELATLNKAIQKFDNMSMTEQREMLRLLAIGGFAGSIAIEDIDEAVAQASQQDARAAYMALLETASDYLMNTGRQVTPDQVLKSAIAYRLGGVGIDWNGSFSTFENGIPKGMLQDAAEAGGLAGTTPQPGTYTTTYKSTDLMNPQGAKGLTRAMLQQELGRDPTQAEYEDFLATLHAAERQDPSVTKVTSRYVLDKNDSLRLAGQKTVTNQGIGAKGLAQLAMEKAQADPKWAEFQAAGQYFPALLSALGATVPGV